MPGRWARQGRGKPHASEHGVHEQDRAAGYTPASGPAAAKVRRVAWLQMCAATWLSLPLDMGLQDASQRSEGGALMVDVVSAAHRLMQRALTTHPNG